MSQDRREGLRNIEVYADWIGLESATRLGTLFVQNVRGLRPAL